MREKMPIFCIRCPESYADEDTTIFATEATHKYNQLQPMCEKHYNETVNMVKAICK